jgi:recombination protein RecA
MALSATPCIDVAPWLGERSLKTAEQLEAALEFQHNERVLALGIPALDEVLPHNGLVQGSIIELQVRGASGAATSFALCACRAAQRADHAWHIQHSLTAEGRAESSRRWCAFIDPSASLFAPGIVRLGVELDRLLVVRPDIDAVERAAIRIAEAKAMSLLVIDLRGPLGDLPVSSHRWPRTVRRLALAIKHLATCVLLITPAEPRQALPLPVALRLEFSRASADSFEVRVGKERSGRVSAPREVPWSVFDKAWQ